MIPGQRLYLELALLDDEEEWRRRRAGDLDLFLGGLLRLGDLDLPFPPDLLRLRGGVLRRGEDRLPRGDGDLRRPRGEGERRRRGEGDLRRGGDRRLGEGRRASLRGSSTGAAVISCPSICPPSMCFMAF